METRWEEMLVDVQGCLQNAIDTLQPAEYWRTPLPRAFGSQRYGLNGSTSDVDLVVVAPANVVQKGDSMRAYMARRLCDKGVDRNSIKDMRELQTLNWSDASLGVEVSILFTTAEGHKGS